MSDDQAKPEEKQGEAIASAAAVKRRKQLVGAGVAVGVGSAAIVAALLYTRNSRRSTD